MNFFHSFEYYEKFLTTLPNLRLILYSRLFLFQYITEKNLSIFVSSPTRRQFPYECEVSNAIIQFQTLTHPIPCLLFPLGCSVGPCLKINLFSDTAYTFAPKEFSLEKNYKIDQNYKQQNKIPEIFDIAGKVRQEDIKYSASYKCYFYIIFKLVDTKIFKVFKEIKYMLLLENNNLYYRFKFFEYLFHFNTVNKYYFYDSDM